MKYYCNPLNVNYRYSIPKKEEGKPQAPSWREAADPSMICFKGKYYIFASMSLDVWVSEDMARWENHRLPDELPLYDYAPDVRVMGDYVYFCASRIFRNCDRYRTRDILNGPYEKLPGTFAYWDPNLFADDDGRVYFYWGCSNDAPIYGTELDPVTMNPMGETVEILAGNAGSLGYERIGEENSIEADTKEAQPYIEGAWVNKHQGRYYMQYAFAGTEYNTYGNGVYVSDRPLGPYTLQRNNPYSYHPGGFFPGAGHGSSMEDRNGNFWHTATMRISKNHLFERRVGLWPAGFDADGELFCNQRYGDWPRRVTDGKQDPWAEPEWMLLSAGKQVSASSGEEGHGAELAVQENVQTWWRPVTNSREEWLQVDLGQCYDIHAIQINFADESLYLECRDETKGITRFIDDITQHTQWKLQASADGEKWFVIEDKSDAQTDLSHDFVVREEGILARYLKINDIAVPYGQVPCVSGLRVFGRGTGEKPLPAEFQAKQAGDLDMDVEIISFGKDRAMGYEILWGHDPEKLYHSRTLFGDRVRIGALVKGEAYYIRIDAFNENGITPGKVRSLGGE